MSYPNASLRLETQQFGLQAFKSFLGSGFDVEPSLKRKASFEVSYRVTGRQLLVYLETGPMRLERSIASIIAERVDHTLLFIIKEGAVRVEADGRVQRLEAGSVIISNLSQRIVIHTGDARLAMAVIPRRHLSQIPIGNVGNEVIGIDRTPSSILAWCELFLAIHKLPAHLRPDDEVALDMALLNAAVPIFAKASELRAPSNSANDLFTRVMEYLRENLYDPELGPDKIAEALGVSRSQVYRAVEGLDQGLKAYIESQRAREAVFLLARGGLSVEEVGRRLGFRSSRQFSSAYKRQFGQTPAAARQDALSKTMIEETSGGFLPRLWRNL